MFRANIIGILFAYRLCFWRYQLNLLLLPLVPLIESFLIKSSHLLRLLMERCRMSSIWLEWSSNPLLTELNQFLLSTNNLHIFYLLKFYLALSSRLKVRILYLQQKGCHRYDSKPHLVARVSFASSLNWGILSITNTPRYSLIRSRSTSYWLVK